MSYTLAFWSGGVDLDPADTYRRFGDTGAVDGVEPVDRQLVVQSFAERLPGWTWGGQFLTPPGVDPENGSPVFDVHLGEQLVEFVGYGMTGSAANAVIDAMRALGFRLYDPQTGERFE
ncbi:hypothetical protein F8O01_14320 [Pseudoclavibacter chungangensis]|uniref:Uncharacterized protein n=1 Tax=Pseudoclavibacter chungangensis TaxID=587635 RepID=A0A7J5BNW9_9MICO|nr:hypothetical protein [Pseudoclavibacter chungangensis]KAB1654085.1 hypothetical protein F8O01_14320 [Pseudoclavibacter chungangensis]NYJ66002.1 hypothetical protein [Pseudoclavibacter chungangensis]